MPVTNKLRSPAVITMIILAAASLAIAPLSSALTLETPFEGKHRILDPTYATPLIAEPGDIVELSFTRGFEPEKIVVESVDGSYRAELLINSIGETVIQLPGYSLEAVTVSAKLPEDLPRGLYNIKAYSGGDTLWSPHSLYIYNEPPEELVVLHMTDVHLGASARGVPNDFKNTRYIVLANTLIRQTGVNVVVVTGDNADIGSDVASYRKFYFQFTQILAPVLVVPGNHDWAQVNTVSAFLESFMGRYVTPLMVWSRAYGQFLIVGLDTQSSGYLTMEQLDYLEHVLASNPDRLVILAMHHPFFSRSGEYSGDIEDVYRGLYGSWRDHRLEAERFLEIINDYRNLVAVLAGHVHRDADSVYIRSDGSRVYFITTTTANHSLPEGYWWGAKIVRIASDGSVEVDTLGSRYEPTHGSINTESFHVYQVTGDSQLSAAWIFDTTGFQGYNIDLSRAVLVFPLAPLDNEPRVYIGHDRILDISVYTTSEYTLVVATADITGSGKIVVAYNTDNEPPVIRVESVYPSKPRPGKPLIIKAIAYDKGWGLEYVEFKVLKDGREIAGGDALMGVRPGEYSVRYVPPEAGEYIVVIEAGDLAGNTAQLSFEIQVGDGSESTHPKHQTATSTLTDPPWDYTEDSPTTEAGEKASSEETVSITGSQEGSATASKPPAEEYTEATLGDEGILLLAAAAAAALIVIAAAFRARS